MKRAISRILVGLLLLVLLIAGTAFAAVEWRWKRTFAAQYPAIVASRDPAIIEKGRYLAYGAAACVACHVPREEWSVLDRGELPPLSGNHLFRLAFGDIYSANLTPDPETGIGRRTDGELARILRYGVRADGRAAFPMMAFHDMADDDLTAVISFLRSQKPMRLAVPDHQFTLLGKTLMGFAIRPTGPSSTPPSASPASPSVERGEYLATRVSSCVECHTDRDPSNGQFVGAQFGGGQRMDVAADPTKVAVPPNLTPDPNTSPMGRLTEDAFVARFRIGETIPDTPMPWGVFRRMTDDDLRSIFRYLKTLTPVEHATGAPIQEKAR